jgi:hypothetical protein
MSEEITWERLKRSVSEPLSQGDRIAIREEPSTSFELTLSKRHDVTKWKCVTVTGGELVDDVAGFWLARIELLDDCDGPVRISVASEAVAGSVLFIGKDDGSPRRPSTNYIVRDFPRRSSIAMEWIAE